MKTKVLEMLKSSANYLSGEEISRQLGVTRAAIWKAIHVLRQEGYPIEAVSNRGYRLSAAADVLTGDEILVSIEKAGLATAINNISFAASADSTNQMARRSAESGAADRSVFIAERQTAGRGRRGRTWLSDHREGLWFSILLRPQGEAAALAKITLFAGLCVAEALHGLGLAAGIKWPNDLVSASSGRKFGGILTEMTMEENRINTLIIGIGINISTREFPPEIAALATSLELESGLSLHRVDILTAILAVFERRYPDFESGDWLTDYKKHCLTLGREIRVTAADGSTWNGRATDLDSEGELVVTDTSGERRIVRSGEVSVRGLLGYI